MAKMIQIPYDNQIVLPVATAQAVQNNREHPISLEALGLLVNLLSYPTTWELHKTELYKRFGKNRRTAVNSAWKDLMDANYIIEFKYRDGKKYEYVYHYRKVPFTAEEKAEILANAKKECGEIWDVDFVHPKMDTSKSTGNQKTLLKKDPLLNKKDIRDNDDDKRTDGSAAIHNADEINLIISNLREVTKNDLSGRSFKSIVRKVVDKYDQGKVNSFRDYLATALIKKIEELELRRAQDEVKKEILESDKAARKQRIQNTDVTRTVVPFYNWLEERG